MRHWAASPAMSEEADPCPCDDVVCQRDEVLHNSGEQERGGRIGVTNGEVLTLKA
jgi:hypothetical protein